jgi:heterotetrameric sarcosine oxidase gamma subunit
LIQKERGFVAEQPFLTARAAFADQTAKLPRAHASSLLRITEHLGLGLATLMARGDEAALAARVAQQFGIDLPSGATRSARSGTAFVGIGPGTWLACREASDPNWASELAAMVSGLASVSDQSSGYAVLRVTGPAARDLLSRGAFIDFHPSVFGPGSAAATTIAHIGVMLWQLDDAPTYDVALFRSYAESFWHWIEATCAAVGIVPAAGTMIHQNERPSVQQSQKPNHVG